MANTDEAGGRPGKPRREKPKREKAARAGAEEATAKPASRAMARVLWQHDFETANPNSTPEQRKENWGQARAHYMKLGKQLQKRLERAGFVIQPTEGKGPAAEG